MLYLLVFFFFLFFFPALATEKMIEANVKTDVKGWHYGVCSLKLCTLASYWVSGFMI